MEQWALKRAGQTSICVAVPRSLLLEARHVALDHRTSLKALVAEGLAHVVAQRKSSTEAARPGAELAETMK